MSARIAILHYHLRPGGVTRVIANTLRQWGDAGDRVVTLSGEAPGGAWPGPVRVAPELGYGLGADRSVAERLMGECRAALGGAPDLIWIHNHNLGKNPALTGAVARWAAEGQRLLLQIHDFAEDGRPDRYEALRRWRSDPATWLYPAGPGVHYALLNRRDAEVIRAAGADPRQVHVLPNPIEVRDPFPDDRADPAFRVYPVRPIRRKNIGELLFRAAGPGGCRYAITLGPTRVGGAAEGYDRFCALARELDLPVEFEAGLRPGCSYEALLARAGGVITTSLAEGFGLVFLESWMAGRSLEGRDLPEITADFKAAGVVLDGLYERWPVAADLYDVAAFRRRWREAFAESRRRYGRPVESAEAIDGGGSAAGEVDFGELDETAQIEAIGRVRREPGRWMAPPVAPGGPDCRAANRRAIMEAFGPSAFRSRLRAMLTACLTDEARPSRSVLNGERILDFFLEPTRFRMLRT